MAPSRLNQYFAMRFGFIRKSNRLQGSGGNVLKYSAFLRARASLFAFILSPRLRLIFMVLPLCVVNVFFALERRGREFGLVIR